jgi:hypothetical protein
MSSLVPVVPVQLPAINGFSSPMLSALTAALGIDRDVLASDQQISTAWSNLPHLLGQVPVELRDEGLMRMCVAVASGLFDSALNYAWNAAVLQLREKVRVFGISIIPQIIDKDFDEKKLLDLRDSELLDLCLKLNLISEMGYFMLNQCRDVRNNFSAAHPVIGQVDEYEFINFLNRCTKHALTSEQNAKGCDIKELNAALSHGAFNDAQYDIWSQRIEQTFDAQREAIIGMLHGIYCDPVKAESERVNALTLSMRFAEKLSPAAKSLIIDRHQRYQAKGETDRLVASQAFFENLGILSLLSEVERHSIISRACRQLMAAHQGMDNFYNERAFAERLQKISLGQQIPETVRREFVETIVTCSVGNQYGTANSADPYYISMIKDFSPREVQVLLNLPSIKCLLSDRISYSARCKSKYKEIINLIQPSSVPNSMKGVYRSWL